MIRNEDKKEAILEAGTEVLYINGYNGTGVKDIVDAAGIPKGSFYNYFNSKESFAIEAVQNIAENLLAKAQNVLLDQNKPPLERLQTFFSQSAAEARRGGFKRGCLMGNLCQEMADVNEPIRTEVCKLMGRMTSLIETCLKEAQDNNEISKDRDIKQMAEFIFNAWEGAILRMKGVKNKQPLNAFLKELPALLRA
ncbi:MAG: TetR/AcrR family transcriptional regulator [Gammaproteobacteria bacterium]|nr:MAG: TetR/AcrR family transcriptional regulator [Gammaproteobacteria bacterium]